MFPVEQQEGPVSPSPLAGRDCLTLAEFSPDEVRLILDEAQKLKALRRSRIPFRPLFGRTLAMVFQKCLEEGVLVNLIAGTTIRLAPPLTVTKTEIRYALDTLRAAVGSLVGATPGVPEAQPAVA